MNHFVKRATGAVGRAFARVSQPVARKLDSHVDAAVTQVVHAHVAPVLYRIEGTVNASREASREAAEELNLVLDSLTREVARLHARIEMLGQEVGERV